jgi:hypothetical protein
MIHYHRFTDTGHAELSTPDLTEGNPVAILLFSAGTLRGVERLIGEGACHEYLLTFDVSDYQRQGFCPLFIRLSRRRIGGRGQWRAVDVDCYLPRLRAGDQRAGELIPAVFARHT